MNNLENVMDQIIDLILHSHEYLVYLDALDALKQEQTLLETYQRIMNEYHEQKKYEQYIDISSIKNELKQIKQEMNENKIVREYYDAYHALNHLLNEVTHLIFQDVLDNSLLQPYFK